MPIRSTATRRRSAFLHRAMRVSRPDAFAKLWPKLRRGYLLDALDRLDGKPATDGISPFVAAVTSGEATRQPSAGLAEDLRLEGVDVLGSGLELEGELIQLSGFTSQRPREEPRRIARPSRRRT